MKNSLGVTCVLAAGIAGYAIAGFGAGPSTDLAAITAFNKTYLKAINDGDSATLSRLTVDDHIMMAPNRPAIVGKAANDELNGRALQQFTFAETWQPQDTVIDGKLAFQRGTFTTKVMPKAAGITRSVTGKFLRIYRRLSDGSWTMLVDMFNSDGADAAPGP